MNFINGSDMDGEIEISSLDDRRKIASLELRIQDLQTRLGEMSGLLVPALADHHASCIHFGRFTVSDNRLEVNCQECGALVDPYFVLRKIAHREVNFCYQINHLRKDRETLGAEVAKLKSQRSSLNQQVKKKVAILQRLDKGGGDQ